MRKFFKMKRFWMIGIVLSIPIFIAAFNTRGAHTNPFASLELSDDPLSAALISNLENYVETIMRENEVPGTVHDRYADGDWLVHQNHDRCHDGFAGR